MWLFFLVAWLVLLAAIAFVAPQAFGYDISHLPTLFASLPMPQRIAAGTILVVGLALIGASAWRLSRQDRRLETLRDRLKKTREDVVVAHALQNHLDTTVQHLIESDPREAVSALHDKLAETEQRALLQQGRNQSTDMHDQLAEIRRRQQALREMVGKVADQRRAVEPVFTEIRDRQNQLERALLDLETDDRKNNLADRLKDISRDVAALLGRVGAVQATFATLNQHKDDLAKAHAELVPLRSADGGINALIAELSLSHDGLAKNVDEIETGGEAPLSARVETLSQNRNEIEQRLARIDDNANILKSIRLDFEELGQRRAQLERSLTEIETDPDGKSLAERQNALHDFVLQSRQRLAGLQETLATLNAFKTELSKSQADLVPLKAPVFGIEAMIADVSSIRDLLARTVGEIEASGDVTLTSRVDALSKSKREVEDRLARIFENFNALDALRKDIGGIFSTIRNSLNRIG
ncbi:hypothetical protein G8O24_11395 [Bradyrhizobium sp. INPA01-394B]|uniref:DUF1049 domain-containing protein n=1 Tax=Bradyrhizobium campsiandrae TaxID=1729892 RepID=A0ABR7U2M7_9BRAD|nr:hypothetical protein [Bradyrhizobium campsiandrae]MBC9877946.1 hypothetical protein [Bradyrhizobium campsiandrae]MBC9978290.1 hypothetical protein [Bradyrhizobium campsiandrae]